MEVRLLYQTGGSVRIDYAALSNLSYMAKYSEEIIQECADWVRENGLIDYGGAKLKTFLSHFSIDNMTYYNWMKKSEFSEAIKKAKEDFKIKETAELEITLIKRAKGYDVQETESEYEADKTGKPRQKKQKIKTRHIQPDTGALIFALTNLAPDKWKNKQYSDTSITGKDGAPLFDDKPLSKKELIRRMKEIEDEI